jgi:hypothetical protein
MGFENNITLKYLKELWDSQNGICPYTKVKMLLPESTTESIKDLSAASLDRIDSSIGYIRNNVEFVCRFINLGKNGHTKKETIEFLKKCGRLTEFSNVPLC